MTEVDYLLVGNGLAPLIASQWLLNHGKKVAILNPEPDFFLENSELPLDPLFPLRSYLDRIPARETGIPGRVERAQVQNCLEELRPFYPGTLEYVSLEGQREWRKKAEFHDEKAPHLRARTRVWLASSFQESDTSLNHDLLDEMYIRFADLGLNPQLLHGLTAVRRFPFSGILPAEEQDQKFRAIQLSGGFDLDLDRYRSGILDFLRERLGPRAMICSAGAMDFGGDGPSSQLGTRVRVSVHGRSQVFHAQNTVVFWTPKITPFIRPLFQSSAEEGALLKRKVRLWERSKVLSKTWTDPQFIGAHRDLFVWADVEGSQRDANTQNILNVLRAGPIFDHAELMRERSHATWVNRESIKDTSALFLDLLRWQNFTVRSLETSFTFVPQPGDSTPIRRGNLTIVRRIDGPISEVVRRVRTFCEGEGIPA